MAVRIKGFFTVVAFAVLYSVGCGGGETPRDTIVDSAIDVVVDSVVTDVGDDEMPPVDTIVRDQTEDIYFVDIVADTAAETIQDVETDTAEVAVECPGNLTCPCNSAEECLSGLCVDTPEGSTCSRMCGDGQDCPDGYTCTIVSQSGTDARYGCVSMFPDLCKPCMADADCIPALGAGNRVFKCMNQDDDGSYCGAECVEDRECPEGYLCQDFGEGESQYTQCVPEDGVCECTPRYAAAGYQTNCTNTNAFGSCAGTRTCDSTCDADTAELESCNSADDNCDGITDNGVPAEECPLTNTIGTCTGATVCAGGEKLCQGAYATLETCNNEDDDCDGDTDNGLGETTCGLGDCVHTVLNCENGAEQECDAMEGAIPEECDGADNDCDGTTDNGFVDTDFDTVRDCVDGDDDDDDILDGDDNCVTDFNPYQEDIDDDAIGDLCDPDRDGDDIDNDLDNCPNYYNPEQTDLNHNDIGDDCEADWDTDGILNEVDNCPWAANPLQENMDFDDSGNVCDCDIDDDLFGNTGKDRDNQACPAPVPFDNCVYVYNPTQQDKNGNGVGDACEDDWDFDTIKNDVDNCPWIANTTQDNLDGDAHGDKCDCDVDGDDVGNNGFDFNNVACPAPAPVDNCRTVYNPNQENMDGDSSGDACDCDIDADGDQNANPGCTNDSDCAPYNAAVFHGATEKCNDVNDDCDSETDEGCDDDGDDYCDVGMNVVGSPAVCPKTGADCNDNNQSVNPGTSETCNGVDDNCSGSTDEGLGSTTCGVGVCLHTVANCVGGEPQSCDPRAGSDVEICDSKDNNCEGATDEGCDDDGDDFCDAGMVLSGIPSVCPNGGGDCNDGSAQVKPGAVEKCDDIDNNCDQDTDEGCDDDDDDWCDLAMTTVGTPSACPNGGGDCFDLFYARNPAASEVCNGVDDNCNGSSDEGLGTSSCGLGVCYHTIQNCVGGETKICDPMQGATTESCDGQNNDCDADTDEGCDDDGDDYCDFGMSVTGTPAVCPNGGNDCNDGDSAVNPSVAEKCNNINDDCDASTDEGCDDDGDDWCDSGMTTVGTPTVCPNGGGDCNDGVSGIRPGATETCNNVDEDCSGVTDDNVAAAFDSFDPTDSCGVPYELSKVKENAEPVSFSGRIYPSLDKDFFVVFTEEVSNACVPLTNEYFRLTINLAPPSGADCVDLDINLYDEACSQLKSTTATGCATEQLVYEWTGTCTSNDDRTFKFAIGGKSASDWECMGYSISVKREQL